MLVAIRSAYVWVAISFLIVIWLPLLTLLRITDRDPARYRTGRWFRRLGVAMTRVNPFWTIEISGVMPENPRRPYVVICNHQSLADIPVVSLFPWEMKWVGKAELWRIPIIGWMMRLAGDIPVKRGDARDGAHALVKARDYLRKKCSVIFFPEGTRSKDGRVRKFNEGAFGLAIREQVPILVLALDGTLEALPRNSWKFSGTGLMRAAVVGEIETTGYDRGDAGRLAADVRGMILEQLARWRGIAETELDGSRPAAAHETPIS
jgi:1-acyl-sn-glycerol-3-phosphate acyltransferase